MNAEHLLLLLGGLILFSAAKKRWKLAPDSRAIENREVSTAVSEPPRGFNSGTDDDGKTETRSFRIPRTTIRFLSRHPAGKQSLLLIRHSARPPIEPGGGNDVELLPEGVELAKKLGAHMGERLMSLHSSPVIRCVQTAQAFSEGAGMSLKISKDHMFGCHSVYIEDSKKAGLLWKEEELGHEGILDALVSGKQLDGFADPWPSAEKLVRHMREQSRGIPGIHVFVTHDSVLTVTAAWALGRKLTKEDWPKYLESVNFVVDEKRVTVFYREWGNIIS